MYSDKYSFQHRINLSNIEKKRSQRLNYKTAHNLHKRAQQPRVAWQISNDNHSSQQIQARAQQIQAQQIPQIQASQIPQIQAPQIQTDYTKIDDSEDLVYVPRNNSDVKVDDSPSDDINYEREGGKVRVTKDLINNEGLDALLVKKDIDNEDVDDGQKKSVNVN